MPEIAEWIGQSAEPNPAPDSLDTASPATRQALSWFTRYAAAAGIPPTAEAAKTALRAQGVAAEGIGNEQRERERGQDDERGV